MDPARNNVPACAGKSLLQHLCPGVTHLIFTGDTGNGFRGMPMAWYYSTFYENYGLVVRQVPLPPGHASWLKDSHFSRLWTFSRMLKRLVFLRGSDEFAAALRHATNPQMVAPRRLIKRTTVLRKIFLKQDFIKVPSIYVGETGIMSVGYMEFSTADGKHPVGSARYRTFADRTIFLPA